MGDVYIVEACRSAIGKRGKGLAGLKPADLLGAVQKGALDRSGIAPEKIDQVIGGCVSQVGEQSFNIARIAWLSQGLPLEVAATTVDSQCGSSQQATTMGAAMVAAGVEDIVMSCGVEMMSPFLSDPTWQVAHRWVRTMRVTINLLVSSKARR